MDGLPDRGLTDDVEDVIEKAKYDILVDGSDAKLKFGKFEGHWLSNIVGMAEGHSYLNWLSNSDFPNELCRLARAYVFPDSDDAMELGIRRKRPKRRRKKTGKKRRRRGGK